MRDGEKGRPTEKGGGEGRNAYKHTEKNLKFKTGEETSSQKPTKTSPGPL